MVERLRPEAAQPGEIVDLAGRVVGRHDGIIHYTVGQRRGLGIGGRDAATAPLYVVRLEPERRRVVVGPRAALGRASLTLSAVNWLGDEPLPTDGLPVSVKIRSAMAYPMMSSTTLPCTSVKRKSRPA